MDSYRYFSGVTIAERYIYSNISGWMLWRIKRFVPAKNIAKCFKPARGVPPKSCQ